MELQTITAGDIQEARIAMKAYRAAVKARHTLEDQMILRGYREILRGRRLINLVDAFRGAGADPEGFPRLAIVRADSKECFVRRARDGALTFATDREAMWGSRVASSRRILLPPATLPAVDRWDTRWHDARAIVPIVPPQFRPADAIENYHILFEAHWTPIPPSDPALLKHVAGYLWAVLAVWDLTELERAVIGQTRR